MTPASWRKDKKTAERGYGWRWQKARLAYLRCHPLCVMCEAQGEVTLAQVVDHRTPHKGDETLFWDESNWQSLCKRHHDSDKKLLEAGRSKPRYGADGWPT